MANTTTTTATTAAVKNDDLPGSDQDEEMPMWIPAHPDSYYEGTVVMPTAVVPNVALEVNSDDAARWLAEQLVMQDSHPEKIK